MAQRIPFLNWDVMDSAHGAVGGLVCMGEFNLFVGNDTTDGKRGFNWTIYRDGETSSLLGREVVSSATVGERQGYATFNDAAIACERYYQRVIDAARPGDDRGGPGTKAEAEG